MYDVLPDLPRFWFVDADEVVRGGGADDDELGKKCAMVPEDWIVDFKWSFLLGGIVKDVVPVDVGGKPSLNTDF